MKKTSKRLVVFTKKPIFADAMTGFVRRSVIQAILHDRLTSFALAKSGKFNYRCQNKLSQASLVPFTEGTGCFAIFVTPGVFQNLARQMYASGCEPSVLLGFAERINNYL